MFEKEKQELGLAEKNLREYTLKFIKKLMDNPKEQIIEYATNNYNPMTDTVKTFGYSISRKDECFLIKYYKELYSMKSDITLRIESYNPILKEFFGMMFDGYAYDKIVERTNKINKFLEVVKE